MSSVTEPVVRRATAADLDAILAIYNDAVLTSTASWDDEPVTLENRVAWLDHHNTGRNATFVAEVDGEVVGFAGYGTFRDKAGYSETVEHSVYLAPEARGRGLGTILLTRLVEYATDQGLHVMIGGLSADNEASLRLHERLGFVEVARMPEVGRKFGRWLDLVMVQLTLDGRRAPGEVRPTE